MALRFLAARIDFTRPQRLGYRLHLRLHDLLVLVRLNHRMKACLTVSMHCRLLLTVRTASSVRLIAFIRLCGCDLWGREFPRRISPAPCLQPD